MIWVLLTGLLTVLVWYKCVNPISYWKNLGVKQTDAWPFLGDTWRFLFRKMGFSEFVEWVYNFHPHTRYTGSYQFTLPLLIVRDPELIKQLSVGDFDHFTDHRNFIDPEGDPLWSRNLFALKGQKWREMRATLSASFTSSKMKNVFHLMDEVAKNFVQFFLNKNNDIIEVEMKDTYTRYTNDVIASSAFGIKCDSLEEPENEFYLMGKEVANLDGIIITLKFFGYFLLPKLFKWLKISFFKKHVAAYFKSIIYETIKTREEKGIVRQDMLNLLLESKNGIKHEGHESVETEFSAAKEFADTSEKFTQMKNLTNDDIISQALIFFLAGFDTISTAMCFGSYELVRHKDIQDKLREEIIETYKKTNGKLTYDILLKMKYLDMVVSEMLRMWTPLPALDRICTKPYTIQPSTPDEKPLHLKVNDVVWVPVHGIHRDPVYYPNPEKFDPERFSDENKHNIKPYTYLPFGSGPRNCIGSRFALLEIKALFFYLLLNFEIVPTKKTQIPLKIMRGFLLNTAEGGFWFGLKHVKH